MLLIDNFDSFVYNLFHYLEKLGHSVDVFRNNEIKIKEIEAERYDGIVISPGPGNPKNRSDFGICNEVITYFGANIPILGICLGHQGVISAFGGNIIRSQKPLHGKTSVITHNEKGIFADIKNPLKVMRYNSLIGEESSLPSCLEITAKSKDDNAIMAVQHKSHPIFGVQFHPESILTEEGERMLENFCNIEEIL